MIATVAFVSVAIASTTTPDRIRPVVIGSGAIAGDPWSASVVRESGAADAETVAERQPCLSINSERFNGGEGGATCTFRSHLTAEDEPLWIMSSQPNEAETETAMSAVAMVFAPSTASVKATLVGGKMESIGLRRLTAEQATTAGLARLRYVAFATAGSWCLARLESFDRTGHRLWRSGDLRSRSCHESWSRTPDLGSRLVTVGDRGSGRDDVEPEVEVVEQVDQVL
ncbi:MAG: hypothetical protein JST59_17795 [Actinobacteria bacterium]|nr:hypothetical protein [Actinomycetota bacterium]